ncbi:peptidoglycan D,D-transpeptidase FtsI family protein [Gulosibacter hominis]|uniref:peptidoglycan D,D-transpeptidase FtsI family protein n=1 Tax=Gulosibacter hominis TaxID=2770504 RepID=UPI00191876E2|nr:penicillin-binding transpeptidase domain-containing protein [Gulosibacter hominis]
MSKNIRLVGIFVLVMFLALFSSATYIQVFQAQSLAEDGRNRRALLASYEVQRGPILVDGSPIAMSQPDNSQYQYQRVYTDPELYGTVTGYFSATQGSMGIEQAMNAELAGTSDSQFFTSLRSMFTGEQPAGAAVELTLNPDGQRIAAEMLGDLKGAVIAIDPATGAILTMYSTPGYDPNNLAMHDDRQVIENYDKLEADPDNPLFNRAIGGSLNPPGSTFKLVVATAALEYGIVKPDTKIPNPPTWKLPGTNHVVNNPSWGQRCGGGDSETTTLRIALQYSCNIPFAQLAIKIGEDRLRTVAERFGFNDTFDVPMTSAASVFPEGPMDDAQLGLTGFGQDNLRTSPLQMALVSAGVANNGVLMEPTVVKEVLTPSLDVLESQRIKEYGRVMSEENAKLMQDMMRNNVENGAADNARIDGVAVYGKTGTAENGDDDPYTLWFTGYAELNGRQVAVAVVLEDGGGMGQSGYGNGLPAETGREVMKAVLGV